ncbi:hypothetical protein HMPREF1378_01924 [Enterococcus faecium R496]|uniref:Uncharacterized protein n=1 Tax=Enterococcus faecium R496 TaxID=1134836 RepID=A0AAV3GU26_ENTFC|nr:hypothetical protein HMPREF1381_01846 [Enterococcus faecium R501]EJX45716.1 hypothetical protein HMPREF1382_00309 [Enterococcus faecium S447]EJX51920.1 hypothetical protein HMPREF1378_01924 [Enterococcus faecium R496]EJX64767.1 hypothetical protein HMPREF1376_00603 [Enterococcus faecium R446]EJX72194.1 hypothetical protein HMPREF1373_01050 [Enterococcus faecium P1140]EJX85703.1 hypothetical protein HMPREF1368_01396 [Enterococcus faecium ERV69]EJX91528.1 hypothetical protein HMPREF1367_0071
MFNKKVNHTKSPPENSFSGGFLKFCDKINTIGKKERQDGGYN